jgi:preprotein translocase subunit SecG
MYTFLSFVYILVCSFLIMVVLLQQGRGGGMGSLGGGSQTVFGGSGAGNLLTRLTSVSAALFMILSATLAWLSSSGDTALEDAMHQREEENTAELHEALEGELPPSDGAEGEPTHEEEAPPPPAEVPSTDEAPPAPAAEAPAPSAVDLVPAAEAPAPQAPAPAAPAPAHAHAAPAHAAEVPALAAPVTEVPAPPATEAPAP